MAPRPTRFAPAMSLPGCRRRRRPTRIRRVPHGRSRRSWARACRRPPQARHPRFRSRRGSRPSRARAPRMSGRRHVVRSRTGALRCEAPSSQPAARRSRTPDALRPRRSPPAVRPRARPDGIRLPGHDLAGRRRDPRAGEPGRRTRSSSSRARWSGTQSGYRGLEWRRSPRLRRRSACPPPDHPIQIDDETIEVEGRLNPLAHPGCRTDARSHATTSSAWRSGGDTG